MTVQVRNHLSAACPIMGAHIKKIGPIPWPKPNYTELYPALINAVAHQQAVGWVSVALPIASF